MNKAIELQSKRNPQSEYLAGWFWDKNEDAIAFYEKNGFSKCRDAPLLYGACVRQSDYIMRKVFIIKMCRVNRGTFQFYTPIS
jgi:hypothetical protein